MRHFLTLGTAAAFSTDHARFDAAEALIIDLATKADRAIHAAALAFLADYRHGFNPKPVFIQIPALHDPHSADVLNEIMPWHPHGILLPEAKSGMDVQHLAARIAVGEARNGMTDGITRIMAIIGQARGSLFAMGSFLGASERLSGLVWSPDGLITRLGADQSEVSRRFLSYDDSIRLGRTLTLIAAADCGIPAIDATPSGIRESAQSRAAVDQARRDGFSGCLTSDPEMLVALMA